MKARLGIIVPIAVYLLFALAVTFPFVLRPTKTLVAPIWGDMASSVARYQAISMGDVNPFVPGKLEFVGFPSGVSTTSTIERVSFLSTLFLWLGSRAFGAIAAHGIEAVLGYVLTASVTFLFVRRVTGSSPAGFVAGLAYGFWPHMYFMNYAAINYSHMWLLILPIWGVWLLAGDWSKQRAVLAGLSVLPAMFWTPYYSLHASVLWAASIAGVIFFRAVRGEFRLINWKMVGFTALPLLAGLFVQWLLVRATPAGVPVRSVQDAYVQSAHPLMYVVPGSGSWWGRNLYSLLVASIPKANFANLYVGLSVLSLAAIGVLHTVRRLLTLSLSPQPSGKVVAGILGVSCVIASLLFSLPPTVEIANLHIPTPNAIVISVQSAFRAGQRFVMPLMGALCILAGLGLHELLGKLSGRLVLPATMAVAALVSVDLWARPPSAITRIPQYPSLERLKSLQPGAAAYLRGVNPQDAIDAPYQIPCLLQPQHGKPLVNHCTIEPLENGIVADRLRILAACEALKLLRSVGVRYVISDRSKTDAVDCFRSGRAGSYSIVAKDTRLVVFGFR